MEEVNTDWNSHVSGAVVVGGIESALTTLQPIRDLAQNWDIDIAACLEDYLVDLEFSQETREHIIGHIGTPMNINFAQAAIVLQNSSGIYSRKVDYLHSYAYKIQEELVSTTTTQNQNGNAKVGNRKSNVGIDIEIEEFLKFDPHQEFLPLNDVVPMCALSEHDEKINLTMADNDIVDTTQHLTSARRRSSIHDSISRRRSSHRPSIGSTALFMDQSFMTDGSGSLMNIATRKALLGTLDTTGSLRLQTGVCDIGDDGILRIPGSSSQGNFDENNLNISIRDDGAVFDNGIDEESNDDGGFLMTDIDDDNNTELMTNQEKPKRVTFSDNVIPTVLQKPKDKQQGDLWALHDGDATNIRKPRPLRIGKTIALPETVDRLPSECVTGARTRHSARIKHARVPKLLQTSLYSSSDALAPTFPLLGSKRALDKNPSCSINIVAYGKEFAYIAKALAKRQADKRRELRSSMVQDKQRNDKSDFTTLIQDYDNDDVSGHICGQFDGGQDDDFDFEADGGDDVFSENTPLESNTGIASISEVYKNRGTDFDNGAISDTRTFEELCRAHIAAFARGAEKYAAETKLSARVGQWQEKLLPLLEEEELRPVFDIHSYGSTVIRKMESQIKKMGRSADITAKSNKVVAFREITRECESFDVCRMFLAALSLNNSGNIQFTTDSTLNALKVELVNSEIEILTESYLSPMAS